MSKVVDIRTYLDSLIEATVTGYVKLSDSYQTSDNPNLSLSKGYSVGFSPGENVSDEWCPGTIRIRRQFQVILTNVYTPSLDPDYREGLENSLLNDEFAIVAAIEKDVTLTGNAITSRFVFDNGLEYLLDDEKQFIIIVATISVTYEENT
jgi:hypothetical protein